MKNDSQETDVSPDPLQWETEKGDAGTYELQLSTPDDTATRELTVLEAASFDLTITSITSPPVAGENIDVDVKITNPGDVEGETDLTLAVDGKTEDQIEAISLTPENPIRKTLTWESAETDKETLHTLVIESDTDTVSRNITPKEPAFFDISIQYSPDRVEAGDNIAVSVSVENTGGISGTQTVSLQATSRDEGWFGIKYVDKTVKEVEITLGPNALPHRQQLVYSTQKDQHLGKYDLSVGSNGDGNSAETEVAIDIPFDPSTIRTNLIRYDGESTGGSRTEMNQNVINASANTVPDNGNWPRAVGSKTPRLSVGNHVDIEWSIIQGDVGYPSANILEWNDSDIKTNPLSDYEDMDALIGQETIDLGTYDSSGRVGEKSVTVDLEDEIGNVDLGYGGDELLSVRLDVDVADKHVPDTGGGYIRDVSGSTVEVRLNYAKIEVNPVLNVAWLKTSTHASNHTVWFETKEVFDEFTSYRKSYDEDYYNKQIKKIENSNRSDFLPDHLSPDIESIKKNAPPIDLESKFDYYDPSKHTLVDCTLDVTPDSDSWPDVTGGRLTSVTDMEATYKVNLAKGSARAYMTIAYIM